MIFIKLKVNSTGQWRCIDRNIKYIEVEKIKTGWSSHRVINFKFEWYHAASWVLFDCQMCRFFIWVEVSSLAISLVFVYYHQGFLYSEREKKLLYFYMIVIKVVIIIIIKFILVWNEKQKKCIIYVFLKGHMHCQSILFGLLTRNIICLK